MCVCVCVCLGAYDVKSVFMYGIINIRSYAYLYVHGNVSVCVYVS